MVRSDTSGDSDSLLEEPTSDQVLLVAAGVIAAARNKEQRSARVVQVCEIWNLVYLRYIASCEKGRAA